MIKHEYTLNNDNTIPSLGLGTWRAEKGLVGEAVKYAILEANYKHIDCASIYKNQEEIGTAFKEIFSTGKIKRDEIFITSKLWNDDHKPDDVLKACKKTLSDLKVDYLDLYLIHWAIAFPKGGDAEPLDKNGVIKTENVSIRETWEAMEDLVKEGLVKSIGISNFNTQSVLDLLSYCKVKPAVNQIELHPYNSQENFVNYLLSKDINVTAYSPLGRNNSIAEGKPKLLDEEIIIELSKKYKKTPAQIILNWGLSRGTIVIPKSTTKERISENIQSLDFELSTEDVNQISGLNQNYRFVAPINWWKIPYFG